MFYGVLSLIVFFSFFLIIWAMKSSLKDYQEIERIYGSVEMIRRIIWKD